MSGLCAVPTCILTKQNNKMSLWLYNDECLVGQYNKSGISSVNVKIRLNSLCILQRLTTVFKNHEHR